MPPSVAGGDEPCTRQRCLQDSLFALLVIRAGDHDKESVDRHTSLDFHASDWTALHDETFRLLADSLRLPVLSHCWKLLTRSASSTKKMQTA
jgi:hypothetical protein